MQSPDQEKDIIATKVAAMVNRGCSDQEIIARLRFVPGRKRGGALALSCHLDGQTIPCAPMCVVSMCNQVVATIHILLHVQTEMMIPQKYSNPYTHVLSFAYLPALASCLSAAHLGGNKLSIFRIRSMRRTLLR